MVVGDSLKCYKRPLVVASCYCPCPPVLTTNKTSFQTTTVFTNPLLLLLTRAYIFYLFVSHYFSLLSLLITSCSNSCVSKHVHLFFKYSSSYQHTCMHTDTCHTTLCKYIYTKQSPLGSITHTNYRLLLDLISSDSLVNAKQG